ncbi:hypothetical protein JM93_04083 [Roseibium hamelinense]|uniref:DUF6455 domain-containing protein n=1 Tax=Roseibium hamelinense TaxID=150831 RepID=A0A562SF44_9HYPH|nr:DUF6455 family protein [Roseibium hamelinense]MTI44244.1 hypothetical protein [Roseibium hamelinense]TWI79971.1 hypothetical protein JM93_04083 [Roseibium hamelinense]
MRWMDRMNERADLMGRMLETIGAMQSLPEGQRLDQELREASSRCMHCKNAEGCKDWLSENAAGASKPFQNCPNAALFSSWLKPGS